MLPPLADFARARAAQLGLPLSTYLAVLLWNYSQNPCAMKQEPAAARFARVPLPCSIRRQVWDVAADAVRVSSLKRNSLIEALVAEDRAGPATGLWIKART